MVITYNLEAEFVPDFYLVIVHVSLIWIIFLHVIF